MVERSDRLWSTGEGNGKSLQHSCLENPMNNMTKQKDMTLKDEALRSVGVQCATVEEWENSSEGIKRLSQSRNKAKLWMCWW